VGSQTTQRAGRSKSEEKRNAILHAASCLFLKQGLQGTSMDAVAREAGVSKQTVYSHFTNKEALFRACIRAKIATYGFDDNLLPVGKGRRETLLLLAKGFMSLIFDPEVMAMHRVVAGEAASYPQIASLFFESGPAAVKRAVGQCLERMVADGELDIPDVEYASWLLSNMAFGSFHARLQLGLIEEVPQQALDSHLKQVVDDFLRLYAA
jgi:TetR/AcrR family transcriptional repressor of mexJK operon